MEITNWCQFIFHCCPIQSTPAEKGMQPTHSLTVVPAILPSTATAKFVTQILHTSCFVFLLFYFQLKKKKKSKTSGSETKNHGSIQE